MRFTTLGILAAGMAAVGIASAEVTVPIDAPLDFYKHSQLVISKATVNPFELAGCLVLKKDGQADQYLNVLPESIKKTLKPQNLSESVYRTMLTKEQAVKVGFLGMLGISTTEKTLLEIAINERWKLEAPSFWGDNELKKIVLEVGKIYASQGYKVSYNQNIQYSTLVTSEYQENAAEVKSAFAYVDGGGKRYVQSSNYSQKELVSISPLDIMPVLVAWNPAVVTSSAFTITKPQIENLASSAGSFTNNTIKLNSADTNELRKFSKQLTSSEFKDKLLK
ncbi:MAG: hypothetical protein V4639_12730 [Pseudomonadota bacterium]